MTNLLDNYTKAIDDLAEYFGDEDFGDYHIEIYTDAFWNIKDGEDIAGWAETEKDLEEEDGMYYEETYRKILKAKELTAILIYYQRELYWKIFSNENHRQNNQ